jgi:hypothetical protein
MSKSWSVLLGALSFAPLLGFFLFVALGSYLAPGSALYANPYLLLLIGVVYFVGSWLTVIGAMVLALRSYHIRQSQRISWAVALFFFNMFALPVFWYKCVWRPAHGVPAT